MSNDPFSNEVKYYKRMIKMKNDKDRANKMV